MFSLIICIKKGKNIEKIIDTIKYFIANIGILISDSSIDVLPFKIVTEMIVPIKLFINTNKK